MVRGPFADVYVLAGPTGAGKTRAALDIAQRIGAEIVSMDSMALYRGMDVGTAKPTPAERARVPHHLIDVLDPWESGSVADWLAWAEAACADIRTRGKRPLVVGGTPLYLKALLFGLFDGPRADAELRAKLEAEAVETGPAALHRRLQAVDPASAAKLHPNDVRRVIRALEVHALTGRAISDLQREWAAAPPDPASRRVVWLDWPRDTLYRRIDARVDQMFADGLVDEARRLLAGPRPPSREASQALGYRETFAHLAGAASLVATIADVKQHSRQFAKRQLTWFRNLAGCVPIAPDALGAWPDV